MLLFAAECPRFISVKVDVHYDKGNHDQRRCNVLEGSSSGSMLTLPKMTTIKVNESCLAKVKQK